MLRLIVVRVNRVLSIPHQGPGTWPAACAWAGNAFAAAMRRIASTDNSLVKEVLALHRRRRGEPRVLVEGRRAIADLLAVGWVPIHLLLTEGRESPPSWPQETQMQVTDRVAQRLSQASTASGYLAVFPVPPPTPPDPARGGLVLAGISDPGNLGTLIRSAAAFAWDQVIVAGGCDPLGPKSIAACAGTLGNIAIFDAPGEDFPAPLADSSAAPCCALVVAGGADPARLERKPRWLIVGSEAHGVPEAWVERCAERITLPMPGGTESLNAGVAGSIACYLLRRDHG